MGAAEHLRSRLEIIMDQGTRTSVWGTGVLGYVRVRRYNKAFPTAPADFDYRPRLVKK